jgi:hypothetical protein
MYAPPPDCRNLELVHESLEAKLACQAICLEFPFTFYLDFVT